MNDISPTAWIVIILLACIIIGTNLSLIYALRNRNRKSPSSHPNRTLETIKHPWDAEDREWNKLSEKVKNLPVSKSEGSAQEKQKE
jgi:hypothetical protein